MNSSVITVLLVEDDLALIDTIQPYLQHEGYNCLTATTGEEGLALCETHEPNVIILDIGLPDMNGKEVCRRIRETRLHRYPYILMLTARHGDEDRSSSLAKGADTYLTKPTSLPVLGESIQAALRHDKHYLAQSTIIPHSKNCIEHPHLHINLENRNVFVRPDIHAQWSAITLSSRQFNLLSLLAKHPGRVWSKSTLFKQIWEDELPDDGPNNSVESCIKNLRSRLREKGPESPLADLIQTVYQAGYKFVDTNP